MTCSVRYAFCGHTIAGSACRKLVIGIVAFAAMLAMTGVYHAGYSDFRSEKMAKPLAGDVVWSVPTLLTPRSGRRLLTPACMRRR